MFFALLVVLLTAGCVGLALLHRHGPKLRVMLALRVLERFVLGPMPVELREASITRSGVRLLGVHLRNPVCDGACSGF